MKRTRLRLHGFKSFVEPSDFVIEPGLTPMKQYSLLSEEDYLKAQDEFGQDSFTAMIGAEAIREILKNMDLPKLAQDMRDDIAGTESDLKLSLIHISEPTRPY